MVGLLSSAVLNICCVGDAAGAVFDLDREVFETRGDGARNMGVPVRSVGVARPVAGNKDNRADGGFDIVGDVSRCWSLGSGRSLFSSYIRVSQVALTTSFWTYLDVDHVQWLRLFCFFLSPEIKRRSGQSRLEHPTKHHTVSIHCDIRNVHSQ